ncbi:MAG: hypothetical protein ACOX6T_26385 [Myxococcales bacterium]
MKTIRLIACLAALVAAGCVGEASVTYKGSVVAAGGEPRGHSFDDTMNPRGGEPIAGAEVKLCVSLGECSGEGVTARSASDGSWGPIDTVFGGFIGSDNYIEIQATAPGYEPYTYRVNYSETEDPTNGEAFLNIRL